MAGIILLFSATEDISSSLFATDGQRQPTTNYYIDFLEAEK